MSEKQNVDNTATTANEEIGGISTKTSLALAVTDNQGNATDDPVTSTTTREKETMILGELGATLNTIQSISGVLEDILRLTDPSGSSCNTSKREKEDNVANKQQKLMKELGEWKKFLSFDEPQQGTLVEGKKGG